MLRLTGLIAGLGLLSVASTASAQQPTVTTEEISPPDIARLNLADVENERVSTAIRLNWSAQFFSNQTHNYEVTYRIPRSEQNPDVPLVDLVIREDSDRAEDRAISGTRYSHLMLPSQILFDPDRSPGDEAPAGCPDNLICVNNSPRSIIVRVFPASDPLNSNLSGNNEWTFTVDTIPPPAPSQRDPLPGENRITVNWERLTEENGGLVAGEEIQFYEVAYCVATSTAGFAGYEPPTDPEPVEGDPEHLPCDPPSIEPRIGRTLESVAVEDGLANGFPTALAVRAVDALDNRGPLSNVQISTPIPVTDFFELHRELGGDSAEEGGFCFVATAAHGSYAHPVVRVLRAFRDRVLAASPAGATLIQAYYENSPPLARWVAERPDRRAAARVALLPVALLSLLAMAAPWFGGLVLLMVGGRRLLPFFRRAAAGVLLLAVALGPRAAQAREGQRPDSTLPIGLGFEFKIGPYLPGMGDDDFDNPAFRLSFGEYGEDDGGQLVLEDGPGANPLFNVGSELQLWRGYGSATLYGSVGFARWRGSGLDADGVPTADDTTLNIVPLTLQVGYRADFIVDYSPVPLVPYVRGGLAYYIYWVTDGSGGVSRVENPDGDDFIGRGGKLGLVATAGVAFLLNFFDRGSTQQLYNSTGIRGTYLFFEGMLADVDGFGQSGFDFSDLSWNAGLHMEW